VKLFLDTDVLLDVYLERAPFVQASSGLLDWAEAHPGSASVSWHGLANLHYLTKDGAEDFIRDLLTFCEVPPTGSAEMFHALELGFRDLEDAMQTAAALKFNAQAIATRNVTDFRRSPIGARTPQDLLPNLR